MSANKSLKWYWIPARGHSGGLATGVNDDLFEVEDLKYLEYNLWVLVRNRPTNFRFWLINVYGPAQHEFLAEFILELTENCVTESLPLIFGGDFNLIRSSKDRNKGQGDQNLTQIFNDFIGHIELREIFVSSPRFTWLNK